MTELELIVISGLAAMFLWWMFAFEYRQYRIDQTRQRLFKIRDELFDKAVRNEIDFTHPAYGMMRSTLNGMIRFTHELSLIRIVILLITQKFIDKSEYIDVYNRRFDSALEELPENLKDELNDSMLNAHLAVLGHVVNSSLVLTLIILPIALIFRVFNVLNTVKVKVSESLNLFAWNALDAEANYIDSEVQGHFAGAVGQAYRRR